MASRKHVIGLAASLALAISAPAFAQPAKECNKPVSQADSEAAHQKYIAGKVEYDEGNYDVAIRRFKEAYGLDCTKHDLLVIISAAYEKKGDRAEAIKALEDYVRLVPTSPEINTYKARIENLKRQLAASQPPPQQPPSTSQPPPSPPVEPPPPADSPSEERGHTPYPWILVGAGAVALAVGIPIVLTAPKRPDNCNPDTQECTRQPGQSDDDLREDRERAARAKDMPVIGATVAGIGGALVIGGLLWHFLEPTGAKKEAARIRPIVTPSYGGLSFAGSF